MSKELDYEEIVAAIQAAPMTYLPALLITTVEECVKKGCFKEGGIENTVKKTLGRLAAAKEMEFSGRRCPECDGLMFHTRLGGYKCNRGCR